MLKTRKRFHPIRGLLLTATALALIAGTGPAAWAQKSESKSSGSQRMQQTPRSSPRVSAPSSRPSAPPRSSPGSTVRSGSTTRSGPSLGSGSSSSRGTNLPRSGYSSGPTPYTKGRIPPSATIRGGPTPGPRYTPRDPGRGDGVSSGGNSSYGYGYGHGHGHGHGHYGFRFGFGTGFYGFYGYPYYFGSHYYRPYYLGLGYGYYPYYYDSYYYPYATRYRTVRVEAQGGLDLNVKPKDTQVYLNGYFIGETGDFDGWPRYLWLDEDVHELIFYKEGYETVVREISVQPDVIVNVNIRMQPGPSTPPEELTRYKDREDRYSSGSYRGDEGYDRESNSRESYGRESYGRESYGRDRSYRDRDDGDLPRRDSRYDERDDRPAPGPPGEVDVPAEAGRLVLTVSPPEASVYIDGRFVGIGAMLAELEEGLVMDQGEHQIQVIHPQYHTVERSITLTAGKETKLGIALEAEN